MEIVGQALYRRSAFAWQGESCTGKVVFAPLHSEVQRVWLRVDDIVLRMDSHDAGRRRYRRSSCSTHTSVS